MALWEEVTRWRGLVSKETGGKLWGRRAILEIKGEPRFLCGECSRKSLKVMESHLLGLSDEQYLKLYEKITGDAIEPLLVPEKYKGILYSEEINYTFRLCQDALIICENCGKSVI